MSIAILHSSSPGLSTYLCGAASEVGHPIHVVQCDKPTLEEIMHVQQQYIDELMRYVHSHFPSAFVRSPASVPPRSPSHHCSCCLWLL